MYAQHLVHLLEVSELLLIFLKKVSIIYNSDMHKKKCKKMQNSKIIIE